MVVLVSCMPVVTRDSAILSLVNQRATSRAYLPWLRVSGVIPALNEARNLPHVLARMPPGVHEVILVDGYSVDEAWPRPLRRRPAATGGCGATA